MYEGRVVPAVGPRDARIVLVGEAPGKWEAEKGLPFVGKAGEVLDHCLHNAGLLRSEIYITNVLKVRPGVDNNDISPYFTGRGFTERGQEWVNKLRDELSQLPANVIIPMGNTATYALAGKVEIKKWRGSVLDSTLLPGRKCIPTIHPASTLREYAGNNKKKGGYDVFFDRYLIARDFDKANRHSAFPELRLPRRNLIIRPEFEHAIEYIRACRRSGLVSYDIETTRNQIDCFALAPNANEAMSVPLTEYTAEREIEIWREMALLLGDEKVIKVGQNLIFDMLFTWQKRHIMTRGDIRDVMIAHHFLYPDLPKKLAVTTSLYTDEPYYKDDGKVWTEGLLAREGKEQRWRYNARDAAVPLEIWDALWPDVVEEGLDDVYRHTIRCLNPLMFITFKGLRLDLSARDALARDLEAQLAKLKKEFEAIAGADININSPKQLMEYFYIKKGVTPFANRKSGESTIDDKALSRLAKGTKSRAPMPEAMLIQGIRRAGKLISTYIGANLHEDNRVRGAMNPVGTKNTRFSSSRMLHQGGGKKKIGMQVQNIPRFYRRLITPDPGYIFIEPDKVQAEWVVVAYIAGDARMMHTLENNLDAHIETAKHITRLPEDFIVAEHKLVKGSRDPLYIEEQRRILSNQNPRWNPAALSASHPGCLLPRTFSARTVGKQSNHGLNYQMGAHRAAEEWEVEYDEALRIVNTYPEIYPGVKTGFWDFIESAIKRDRTLFDLFGRKRVFLGEMSDTLIKEALDYMPQSTVARLTAEGMCKIYEDRSPHMKDIELMNNTHDGLLIQIPLGDLERLALVMETCAQHLDQELCFKERRFHIKTDFKLGFDWAAMVDVKGVTAAQIAPQLPKLLEEAKEEHERSRRGALREVDSADDVSEDEEQP